MKALRMSRDIALLRFYTSALARGEGSASRPGQFTPGKDPLAIVDETYTILLVGRNNSVGIATSYGLDGPGIESRLGPGFSAHVHTGPRVQPASYTELFISPSGISAPCGTVAGWSRRRAACQQRERHCQFLSYLTGARYVHPW
jgi:hypothetical protein